MGTTWSQSESWQALVTKEEVRDAVKGFEAWQKTQEDLKSSMSVQRSAPSTGPLLERIGGPDAVRRMVEAFCRKLYGDEKLMVFLEHTDMTSLRAKQCNFLTWLFNPRDQPNTSRHMRTAHLRIIKQRGFARDHFELGLTYFEAAVREQGLSEALVKEVMAKVRPYKEITFTPLARDAEDEKRWALAERLDRSLSAMSSGTPSELQLQPAPHASRPVTPPSSLPPSRQSGKIQLPLSPAQQQHQRQQPSVSLSQQQLQRLEQPGRPLHHLLLQPTDAVGGETARSTQPPSPSTNTANHASTAATSPNSTASFPVPSVISDSAAAVSATAKQLQGVSPESSLSPSVQSANYSDILSRSAAARNTGASLRGNGSEGVGDVGYPAIVGIASPLCPFTGARLSRPATSASELPTGVTEAARPVLPLVPPPPLRPVSSGPATPPGDSIGAPSSGPLSCPLFLLPPPPPLPLASARSSMPSSGNVTPQRRSNMGYINGS
ncbi:hypothetical protein Vafri_20099 [Volvox africanus]|uniref:Uncharacterized protein n=1 Tax=Volvox africanus TaxID=51714 RepID=A0A8J4FA36_9CHLO|nr:hypothetical protein Vafri_20099 [Volvox africanus]